MKKLIIILLAIAVALFLSLIIYYNAKNFNNIQDSVSQKSDRFSTESSILDRNTVSYNGWLHTDGYMIKNEKNEPIQLRGVSSHGIEWFSNVVTYENLQELKNNWKINVFRIAMYTDSNGYGYTFSPESNKETAYKIIDMLVDLDMYVIIDWHILSDNNPQTHIEEAKSFFEETSSKYSKVPNVIYEICNEPNGSDVTWNTSIKPYSETIIPIIRNNSEKSLIVVGTPDWCKDLSSPTNNPLDFPNIVYSCHFYSGSHGSDLRRKIDNCIRQNIPIFISECGLTDATGNGDVYFEEFTEWVNYLNSRNLSWIYWSFSNKKESSSILVDTYVPKESELSSTKELPQRVMDTPISEQYNISTPYNTQILEGNAKVSDKNNTTSSNSYTQNRDLSDNNSESSTNRVALSINDYLTESGKFIKNIFLSYLND